jgi:hypothetical protein
MSYTGIQSRAIFHSRQHVRLASHPWTNTQSSRQKHQPAAPCSCSLALAGVFQDLPLTEILVVSHKTEGDWWEAVAWSHVAGGPMSESFNPRGGGI